MNLGAVMVDSVKQTIGLTASLQAKSVYKDAMGRITYAPSYVIDIDE